jgi:outer membrane protein
VSVAAVGLRSLVVAFASLLPWAAGAESLLPLYDEALKTNPALRSRDFGIAEARAQKDLARSRLLPQVNADGSYDWNEYNEEGAAPERYNGTRGVISAKQPLLDLPSYYRLRGAQSAVEQSEHERKGEELAVTTDVVERYLAVLQAEDEIANLASEKGAIDNQLKRLRFMRERQLAKVTDVYEVEAYYQALLTREIEARNKRAISLERLREVTGLPVATLAPLARESFPVVEGDEAQWVSDAVESNPHLLAMSKASEASKRLVSSGRSEHLPRLSLAASQVYADQGYDNRQVPEYDVGSVGFVVSVPIYEGGRVQATVRDAEAKYRRSLERYEAARREIERSVRSAYLNTVASHARIGSTGEERRALEKVVQSQERSRELGVTTVLDVLIARRRLVEARSAESKARYDYIRDLTMLRAHVGGLERSHIEEIDGWLVAETRD